MDTEKFRPRVSSRILRFAANCLTLTLLLIFTATSLGERIKPAAVYIEGQTAEASVESIKASLPSSAALSEEPLPVIESESLPSDVIPDNYIECDLSCEPLTLINETSYTPDCAALLESGDEKAVASFALASEKSPPIALVLHTHGTEGYAPNENEGSDYAFRSSDTNKNVVAVGAVLAETLNENGVPTLHCTIMHDEESYLNSYIRAAETIRDTLERFPSIIYIFDVHRDAIERGGSVVRPCTYYGGEAVAQVMSVVGTDERGAAHPYWRENLTLALRLQLKADELCPSISRAVNLRSASFNEQYAPGSLLLEIGSHGNTLQEAKRAAVFIGRALASLIKSGG